MQHGCSTDLPARTRLCARHIASDLLKGATSSRAAVTEAMSVFSVSWSHSSLKKLSIRMVAHQPDTVRHVSLANLGSPDTDSAFQSLQDIFPQHILPWRLSWRELALQVDACEDAAGRVSVELPTARLLLRSRSRGRYWWPWPYKCQIGCGPGLRRHCLRLLP